MTPHFLSSNILGWSGGQTALRGWARKPTVPSHPLTLALSPEGRGNHVCPVPVPPASSRATPPLPSGERAGVRGAR
jgi:hypothetical protein